MNYKKLLILLLFSIMIIPMVHASGDISIKSVTLESKSETTTIRKDPEFNGLEINYNLGFENVNDFANYLIEIENNTDKDYVITKGTSFKLSDYVEYTYTSDQMIKHNNRAVVSVSIKYVYEVEDALFQNEKYTESNKAILQILDDNNEVVTNPKTGDSPIKIALFVVIVILIIVLAFAFKKKSLALVLIICLCSSPILLNAVEELNLTINVDVVIEKTYKVGYFFHETAIIKESEKKYYDLSKCTCNKNIYIGSVDNGIKYKECKGLPIRFDSKRYKAGETVTFNGGYEYRYQLNNEDDVTIIDENNELFKSEDLFYRYSEDYWEYSRNFGENAGYPVMLNDKETMNFSNIIIDYWNDEEFKSITSKSPFTFKMPAHDVVFKLTGM